MEYDTSLSARGESMANGRRKDGNFNLDLSFPVIVSFQLLNPTTVQPSMSI